jgi:hypothetical protein
MAHAGAHARSSGEDAVLMDGFLVRAGFLFAGFLFAGFLAAGFSPPALPAHLARPS